LEGISNTLQSFFTFDRLLIVFLLTALINLINTLVRSSRLAGVRTGRLATAISLFGIIFLAASFANTLQGPLLASTMENSIVQATREASLGTGFAKTSQGFLTASTTDKSIVEAVKEAPVANVTESVIYQEMLKEVNGQLRLILCGAALGVILGMLLIPSFITTFTNVISAFGRTGSVFRLVPLFFTGKREERIKISLRLSTWASIKELLQRPMATPSAFLFWSAFSYSIWMVNVLAGIYAAAMFPEYRSVVTNTAAIFGNGAIILNVMMVDPILARVTDGVANGSQSEMELKQIILFLALANLAGAVLSQLLFLPVAQLILKLGVFFMGI
jgi:hypothetical protein